MGAGHINAHVPSILEFSMSNLSEFYLPFQPSTSMVVTANKKVLVVIGRLHDRKLFVSHQAVTLSEKEQVKTDSGNVV